MNASTKIAAYGVRCKHGLFLWDQEVLKARGRVSCGQLEGPLPYWTWGLARWRQESEQHPSQRRNPWEVQTQVLC